MVKIAPSILSADFSRLGEQVAAVEQAGAEYLHIDVMDGHFVPNITIGPLVVKSLRPMSSMVFDVHLMITNPERYIDDFASAGADIITVHAETCPHLHRVIQSIKETGARAGVALNPATPLSFLEYVLTDLDLVLLMTVNPGFGGQAFIPNVLPKIRELKQMEIDLGLNFDLEVDGGINPDTARDVTQAGANVLVAGSAIFGMGNIPQAVTGLRQAALGILPGQER